MNHFRGTTMAEVSRHMMRVKGWTAEQVQSWYERAFDRLGADGRSRLIARVNNRIIRAWVIAAPSVMWMDERGLWARRGSSSNILVKSS